MIHPHQLTKYQRRFPLFYDFVVQALADDRECKRGNRDLEFVLATNRHAIDALVLIYDLYCHDEAERKRVRSSFRKIVARHDGRLAPYYHELHSAIRSRLHEHKMMVRWGLDAPDTEVN
jgi:hypothetical protein